ncbi:ABC transporter ATP-binding protein [Streptomyces sp. cg35]|uniref:ABC transporter ATP-binding protein n=1 Tax=Streptomyces sp. cg35 TaxID=3421650 RepID=UPI003D16A9A1
MTPDTALATTLPADHVAEIRGLRVRIGGTALVDGIDLAVRPGETVALVGTSGSGKTTTGLALLGEFPDGAEVSGDVCVAGDGPVGYVPQDPAAVLNPARSADALLRDIARAQVRHLPFRARRAETSRRIRQAAEAAQLPEPARLLRRYPHQLSGGQQQRVVLAQALLLGARVVVADEPTTGLDPVTKSRVVERLAALAAHGVAVVLLSHDLDVVRGLADHVLVLRGGRVVESGPPERLWTAPRHPWTRELLAPPPERTRQARPGHAPVLRVRDLVARHRDGSRPAVDVLRLPALDVRGGECLAVLGRSGSGKTTLARCLAGLHRDHDGRLLLDGAALPRSVRRRDRAQLASVQYVFQDARGSFDAFRDVLDQVARTAVTLRDATPAAAREEALGVLAELGLEAGLVRRRPGQLSGGELQRAALARALLARPRVLVCDEVTSGLDSVTRRGLLDVLAGLLRERDDLSLVLITHDLDTAALADRVVVLEKGALVDQGPAPAVLEAGPFRDRNGRAT